MSTTKVLPSGITIKFKKVGNSLYADLFLNGVPDSPLYRLSSQPLQGVKKTIELADAFAKKFNLSAIKSEDDWNALPKNKKDAIGYARSSMDAAYMSNKGAKSGHYSIDKYKTESNISKVKNIIREMISKKK